jgi:hypothetical protein
MPVRASMTRETEVGVLQSIWGSEPCFSRDAGDGGGREEVFGVGEEGSSVGWNGAVQATEKG